VRAKPQSPQSIFNGLLGGLGGFARQVLRNLCLNLSSTTLAQIAMQETAQLSLKKVKL
jgi:hypothetical protein